MNKKRFIVSYYYENGDFSKSAAKHAFDYLSAFADIKFVEDIENPAIWRGNGPDKPKSALVVLGRENISMAEEIKNGGGQPGSPVFLKTDTIKKIIEKISINVKIGPYSDEAIVPDNSQDESLANTVKSFYGALREAGIIDTDINISIWPDRHKFCAVVTHDVYMVKRSIPGSIKLLVKKDVPGGIRGLYDSIRSSVGITRNPYDRIQDWIDLENRFGIKSTYFVFAGNRINKLDPKYKIDDLKEAFRLIVRNGHEAALHSGIDCKEGNNIDNSKADLERASESKISGMRPHYLSAFTTSYWRSAADNDMNYTSCLGFDDDIGFYKGIDLPFVPFDIENNKAIKILEMPIAVMDCGLIRSSKPDIEASVERGLEIIERAGNAGGILILDWHQRTMYIPDYPGWVAIFEKLVERAIENGAIFLTMGQAAEITRAKMANKN